MIITKLPPIPKTGDVVPAVKDFIVWQGLEKIRSITKNKDNINRAINLLKEKVHGLHFPQPQQQQRKQRRKKRKISRGAGGPSSDEEFSDGLIDGLAL